jgi:transcriptional regulator with XRE-family HTH domain
MLTPIDCLAARSRLRWTREKLANEAGLSVADVTAFELDQGPLARQLIAALTGALEAAQAISCGRLRP